MYILFWNLLLLMEKWRDTWYNLFPMDISTIYIREMTVYKGEVINLLDWDKN